jgi:hypothetical protein
VKQSENDFGFSLGLPDVLGPPYVPLAVPVQELPQVAPHLQAADGLLGDRHSPDRVRHVPVHLHLTHVSLQDSLGYVRKNISSVLKF